MSFNDITIAVRAENQASNTFRSIALDVASLGTAFGLLTNDQARAVSIAFTAIRVFQSMSAILKTTAIAYDLEAAACWVANSAMTALNISFGTFLALTGVGIAAIVAAAAAMAYFSSQMNSATSSVKSFNQASAVVPERTRSIQRAGEQTLTPTSSASARSGTSEAELLRRGIE
ncbi:MAG: hypothetical protein NWF00_04915 [Candidatus Bathyarchaeota archaeon]|nr:hypothetical protein [Candidatus Bathyarchaeota archaeon]